MKTLVFLLVTVSTQLFSQAGEFVNPILPGGHPDPSNMGRETHLMPVVWEPITIRWQQVSDDKWEPVKYQFPVVAPETGKVERYTSMPFMDKEQY